MRARSLIAYLLSGLSLSQMEFKVLLYSMFPVLLSQMAEYSLIVASVGGLIFVTLTIRADHTFGLTASFRLCFLSSCIGALFALRRQIISIGHLSSGATDLAAASLASMTSSVVSFSVLQGLASARVSLDSLLSFLS